MANPADLKISVHSKPGDLESTWRALQAEGTSCIYQDFDWVSIAYRTQEKAHKPLILYGELSGKPQFIVPLVIEEGFPKTVRWPGNTHSNICSGIFSVEYLQTHTHAHTQKIVAAIRNEVSGVAVLNLRNQLPTLGGHPNPLLTLPNQPSMSIMYDMDLRGGLDPILDAGNGKRKRKLFRRQVRVATEMGGHELVIPKTDEEIRACLDDFYEQKTQRFSELGVKDVFAPAETREFLYELATAPKRDGIKLLDFFELKVGGKTRALYGCAIYGDYCQAWVNSVTYDDFADLSPGEMVLYMMIERLIEDGFSRFDLGVGTERYKKSWCKTSVNLVDVMLPLSASAWPIVASIKSKAAVKAKIRNSETLWPKVKKLRQRLVGNG
ncbi:MAG: GNAT family N-acetyltransferase [Rhizobiaceae bacterium]|nr:GNAT family N-acetyltransferase [Rhizobiaceae bacterium]